MLADGAQFGVDDSTGGLQLGDRYCVLNVRCDSKAGQAAGYHLSWIEALVTGHS